jgi:hypothetical protein
LDAKKRQRFGRVPVRVAHHVGGAALRPLLQGLEAG